MKEYVIQLPNEKTRTYRLVMIIVLLINCLAFGMLFVQATNHYAKRILLAGMIMSTLPLIFFAVNNFRKRSADFRTEIIFIILAICWLMLGKYLVAVFIILFSVAGFYSITKFNVIFSTDHISYPSFPVKKFLWTDVSNVILKDNVLTIDLKNNKLIQSVIEKESADAINEAAFNEFCRQRIED